MKIRTLYPVMTIALFAGFGIWYVQNDHALNEGEMTYQPRNEQKSAQNASGAFEWMNQIRANQITGEINPADELQAMQQAQMSAARGSSLGLSWEEMGPDNYGGRTRAFLQDKDDANLMLIGGVSSGIYRSTNSGATWVPVNIEQENMAISCFTQASNGDIYAGTGEGMYYGNFGTGTGGMIGGGIFKSTDRGLTFTRLASTVPAPNNTGTDWASVGFMATSLTNPNVVFASTNRGYRVSEDGGTTWENPVRNGAITVSSQCTDIVQDNLGGIWTSLGMQVWYSPNGIDNFVQITKQSNQAGPTDLPQENGQRIRLAVSPQDPNYIYALTCDINRQTSKIYRSINKGETWSVIGQRSATFNPVDQGRFAMSFNVSAQNKDHIFCGGLHLWEWKLTQGWQQITTGGDFPGNPFYVHVDQHNVFFNRINPSVVYATNDGGLFRSENNGITWAQINKNFISTQFYSVAYSWDGEVMGGTQDNGTLYVTRTGNTEKTGFRTVGMNYRGSVRDGDGGYAEISQIDKNWQFKAMQYGILGRSNTAGVSFDEFYDFAIMDPDETSQNLNPAFAPFVTVFKLWENRNDPFSTDSVQLKADDTFQSLGFGQNRREFKGFLNRPSPSAKFVAGTFKMIAAFDTLVADVNGVVTGPNLVSGTFDAATGEYDIEINSGLSAEVILSCGVFYNQGDTVIVRSNTLNQNFTHVLTHNLPYMDSIMIQDPIQTMFFVGLNSGLWMTRNVFADLNTDIEWVRLTQGLGGISALDVAPDGTFLVVGSGGGTVLRISDLHLSRDSASSDFASTTRTTQFTNLSTTIGTGRFVTSISINPTNPNQMLVTYGNYGNQNYIAYTTSAQAGTPSFINKTGDLPRGPVYSGLITSQGNVLVGTEFGAYSTNNIGAAQVQWAMERNGMGNTPVLMMREQMVGTVSQTDGRLIYGRIFAGTHGRGMFRTTSLATIGTRNFDDNNIKNQETNDKQSLKIYPNPASDYTKLDIDLTQTSDVEIVLRDMTGRAVKRINFKSLDPDTRNIKIDLNGLRAGTYIVEQNVGSSRKTGKLIMR